MPTREKLPVIADLAMKFTHWGLGALAVAMILALPCRSQVAAPASLPSCLIQYSSGALGYNYSRLILYNSDRTYVEINSYNFSFFGEGTNPPQGGKFTYTVDPLNPAHATIAYDGGLASDQLYFYATNSGSQSPISVTIAFTAFTLYPRQIANGASNVSTQCQLATAGMTTSGLVVQSGGPRWVLLRAVGASLGNFGVSAAVSSPALTLYSSTQAIVGASSVWSSDPNLVSGYQTIFSLVGAFPLNAGSDEGVLLVSLNPGAYTAQFKAGSPGTILFETYILPF